MAVFNPQDKCSPEEKTMHITLSRELENQLGYGLSRKDNKTGKRGVIHYASLLIATPHPRGGIRRHRPGKMKNAAPRSKITNL